MHGTSPILKILTATLLTGVLFLPFSAFAAHLDPALSSVLAHSSPVMNVPVIVTFSDRVDTSKFHHRPDRRGSRADLVRQLKEKARTTQTPIRDLLQKAGVSSLRELWIINGLALEATPEQVKTLASWPGVASVTLDGVVTVPEVLPAQIAGVEWNVEAVHAPELWALGYDGSGVVVATLDSGVDALHPDLSVNQRPTASWFNPYAAACALPGANCTSCDASAIVPCDAAGHGTGVMGVAVGGGGIGVAPGAEWIAAKIFNDDGEAPYSVIHAAFQWALDPDGDPGTDDAPDVVNNSWGLGGATSCIEEFRSDIQALKSAGIAVVFAAGNDPALVTSPANYPESLAVGAVNQSNLIASFSSRGPSPCDPLEPFPELVAPGVQIRTADRTFSGSNPDPYRILSGTSFSTPHVSGVMALLLNEFPALFPSTLEAVLYGSALDLGPAGADNSYGYGLVNAYHAHLALSGTPVLSVHDPVLPVDDGILPFGNVAPGTSKDLVVTVTNVGGGLLGFSSIGGGGLVAPFSLVAEDCSSANLVAGESCSLTIRFAPVTHAAFSDSLEILSGAGLSTVVLSGSGNTPPDAPALVFPANGARALELPVTLGWVHPGDADGDPVIDELLISTSPQFVTTLPVALALGGGGAALAAFALAGFFGLRRLRWRVALAGGAAVLVLTLYLVSCGGGGGAPPPLQADRTYVATNLAPATTYYWKVVASDGLGGTTESAVWSFTMR